MLAAQLSAPGSIDNLCVVDLPIPEPQSGWVRLKVMAFGLNRSEYHSIIGVAGGMTFPRVLGIEAAGVVDLDPDGVLAPGTQAATMMGGMGRAFDGGYAQYVVVPREQVITFESELPWEVIGSVPETLQTAYGSLTVGLNVQPGQSLLIRGGTSALGLATASIAKSLWGATVFATSRKAERLEQLREHGVDHPLLDDGDVAAQVRQIAPEGADNALELVGVPTLKDTLAATKRHGMVCFSGMLSDSWTIRDFYPLDWLPYGVGLTAYSGGAESLPADVLQRVLDSIAAGATFVPIHAYPLERIRDAHRAMAEGRAFGKLVGLPWA